MKVNEDSIAEMLGVEGKPTSYITPEHTANPDDTRLEGSAIVQGEATILTTPVHQDNNGLLVNIPVGEDVNSNSGGYQPHSISLDDLVMMAEEIGPNVTRHSDGSYRTSDGKFASVRGVASPGTNKASEFVDHLRKNGMDVVGEEVVVSGPLGDRRYDAVIRDKEGRLHGLEIKSGSATRNGYQEFSDIHVNQFGADGKGVIRGERVESSSTVYVP